MQKFLMSTSVQQEIISLDSKVGEVPCNYLLILSIQIHDTVDQINTIKLQREFYLGFAQNPQVTII